MYNAITGIHDHLYDHLVKAIEKASSIRIAVAFLMESGVHLLCPYLVTAANRGVPIKILTGRYLSVTEPSAIYMLLLHLEDRVDIRFFENSVQVFHPKAYIIDYENDGEIFVGSSNMSQSALKGGVEWNYRLQKKTMMEDYQRFSQVFDELFFHHATPPKKMARRLKEYALTWKKPRLFSIPLPKPERPVPRGAQIEALYALKRAREEGIDKGLVIAATGTGKTFLSAFDAMNEKRILYLAHREEILKQAYKTYGSLEKGHRLGFYYGDKKEEGADIYFATVQTLSREEHLVKFPQDFFDYLVVDEFHHAAANSYQKLINYFQPGFLLGLTATPFRSDNQDIFALCDDNVIYEINIRDAINREILVPFHYYGIHDETDYNGIQYQNNRYLIEELERELSKKERAHLIFEKYMTYGGERAIAFCASIAHAQYMARFFQEKKVPVAAVHSSSTSDITMDRQEALLALEKGEIKVIFAVDMFNEGVDIPALDTVLFLRPTESFVIFLQQLGRGLRQHEGKEYLRVLDFIGNYKRAHYIPSLLAGENPLANQKIKRHQEVSYPVDCMVHFDFKVLDLFEALAQRDPLPGRMERDYFRIKEELGVRPERLDIYERSDIPVREFLKKGWLSFLWKCGELTREEEAWLKTPAEDFLQRLEVTGMSKAYKIPTLQSLLTKEGIQKKVSLKEVGRRFQEFYQAKPLHQKDLRGKKHQGWEEWEERRFEKEVKDFPIYFLCRNNKYFHYDEINQLFYLDDSLDEYLSSTLGSHVQDILNYRYHRYFHTRYRENN